MSDAAGVVVLIGRIMFAYWFIAVTGVGHFKNDRMMRGFAQQAGFPSRPSPAGLLEHTKGAPGCPIIARRRPTITGIKNWYGFSDRLRRTA